MAADLFGGHSHLGLSDAAEFITEKEETDLIAMIEATELAPFQFQQWVGKRRTRSFGWKYDFQTASLSRADPFPEWLKPITCRAARFAGVDPEKIAQALLTSYAPGAGIGWHRDRPIFGHVIGISLGAEAVMRFRRRVGPKFERIALPLAPRSVYHLSGEIRHGWEHSIRPVEISRWSITLRTLRET